MKCIAYIAVDTSTSSKDSSIAIRHKAAGHPSIRKTYDLDTRGTPNQRKGMPWAGRPAADRPTLIHERLAGSRRAVQ